MKEFWTNYDEARNNRDSGKLAQLINPSFTKCLEEEVADANSELNGSLQPLLDTMLSIPECSDKFLFFCGITIKLTTPASSDVSYDVDIDTLNTKFRYLHHSFPEPLVLSLTFSRNENGIRLECVDGFREILILRHEVLFS